MNNNVDVFMDFVLCADWGISKEAYDEDVITASVKKAYSDASRRVFKNMNSTKIQKAETCIINSIKNFPEGIVEDVKETCEKYDAWHKTLCDKVCKEVIGDEGFTYGHAQKWVNMSVKYVWLLSKVIVTVEKLEILKSEKFFHIPLDSYVLEGLKKKFENSGTNRVKGNMKLITGSGESYYLKNIDKAEDKAEGEAWSKISTYESYMNLQEKIRNEILKDGQLPLVYENKLWIKASENRKKKN